MLAAFGIMHARCGAEYKDACSKQPSHTFRPNVLSATACAVQVLRNVSCQIHSTSAGAAHAARKPPAA